MTTVPNDPPDDSPATWLNFANSLFREGKPTWFCTSWVPWFRYIMTIIIVVLVTAAAVKGLLPWLFTA